MSAKTETQQREEEMPTCIDCGTELGAGGEFHPYSFCVLRKAGIDPWAEVVSINKLLGLNVEHWPAAPPLVRDLPAFARTAVATTQGQP